MNWWTLPICLFIADSHGPPRVNIWQDPLSPSKWKEEHVSLIYWKLRSPNALPPSLLTSLFLNIHTLSFLWRSYWYFTLHYDQTNVMVLKLLFVFISAVSWGLMKLKWVVSIHGKLSWLNIMPLQFVIASLSGWGLLFFSGYKLFSGSKDKKEEVPLYFC